MEGGKQILIFQFEAKICKDPFITFKVAPMHTRRCYVSVAELRGLIYAIGGYDGHNRLSTVERYNPKTNQWTVITPMNMQRSDASACTLKERIYATGNKYNIVYIVLFYLRPLYLN